MSLHCSPKLQTKQTRAIMALLVNNHPLGKAEPAIGQQVTPLFGILNQDQARTHAHAQARTHAQALAQVRAQAAQARAQALARAQAAQDRAQAQCLSSSARRSTIFVEHSEVPADVLEQMKKGAKKASKSSIRRYKRFQSMGFYRKPTYVVLYPNRPRNT